MLFVILSLVSVAQESCLAKNVLVVEIPWHRQDDLVARIAQRLHGGCEREVAASSDREIVGLDIRLQADATVRRAHLVREC
jgi:hypothetical protein